MSGDMSKNNDSIFVAQKGYTLIEMMVVVVIVAILAAIAIPSYERYVVRAARSQAQAEMLKIAERLENYRGKQLSYAGFKPEHQYANNEGIVNIPYDATTNYKYQIQLVDEDDPTKSVEKSAVGQGWKMIATPYQDGNNTLKSSESILLTSLGVRCMTTALLTNTSVDCGDGTKVWE